MANRAEAECIVRASGQAAGEELAAAEGRVALLKVRQKIFQSWPLALKISNTCLPSCSCGAKDTP